MCYFGEYPLAWAVCFNDKRIYNRLVAYNANPNLRDSFGNTVLHVIVIKGITQFYSYALRHPIQAADETILNNDGLSPMALACTLGRNKIFNEIVEPRCFDIWTYSSYYCCGYPLTSIDSLQLITNDKGQNIQIGCRSALTIILNGQSDDHIEMLRGGIIQKLLEEKWKAFGHLPTREDFKVCIHRFPNIQAVDYYGLKSFDAYDASWMNLFKMTLGNHQYNEIRNSYYQWMTQLYFVVFMILVPILLLNMLIAMMGNTYSTVISQSEREWNMQWAKIVLEIEKSLTKKEGKRKECELKAKILWR
ncbi:uncharacterized protein B4U79_04517, partial [Dinothrombium tinctorium]